MCVKFFRLRGILLMFYLYVCLSYVSRVLIKTTVATERRSWSWLISSFFMFWISVKLFSSPFYFIFSFQLYIFFCLSAFLPCDGVTFWLVTGWLSVLWRGDFLTCDRVTFWLVTGWLSDLWLVGSWLVLLLRPSSALCYDVVICNKHKHPYSEPVNIR